MTGIGNNVTLTWAGMDFGGRQCVTAEIEGQTDLPACTVSIRIRNDRGEEMSDIAEFSGTGGKSQRFALRVPDGVCTVSFVFLPGSSFDFGGFRFYRTDGWTEPEE